MTAGCKKSGNNIEVNNLHRQLSILRNKMNVSKDRLEKDKKLLKSGGLSEREYNKLFQDYLEGSNNYERLKSDVLQKGRQKEVIDNDYSEDYNTKILAVLNTEIEINEFELKLRPLIKRISGMAIHCL